MRTDATIRDSYLVKGLLLRTSVHTHSHGENVKATDHVNTNTLCRLSLKRYMVYGEMSQSINVKDFVL